MGEYRDGKRNGKGKYTFAANGCIYEGEYVNNLKHGHGILTYPDKSRYEGEFYEDKRSGQGTYIYSNHDIYIGNWKNDKKHGKGKYIYSNNGNTIEGIWSNNRCMHGTWQLHDKSYYTGKFLDNRPQGKGIYTNSNGIAQSGYFTRKYQWKSNKFYQTQSNTKIKLPTEEDKAKRLINRSILLMDLYQGMNEIEQKNLKNIVNFKQIKDYPIYTSGQPSNKDDMIKLLEYFTNNDIDNIIWIVQRNTPVIFFNKISCSPRI